MLYTQKAPEGIIYRREGDTFKAEGAPALQEIRGTIRFIYATEKKPEYTLYITLADNTLIGIALSDVTTEAYEVVSALAKAAEAGIDFLKPVSIAAYPEGCKVTAYDTDTPRLLPPAEIYPDILRQAIIKHFGSEVNKSVPPSF